MNPSGAQQNANLASSAAIAPSDLDRIRTFTGSYYRVLGWIDLVASVISLAIVYWTGHLAITFGFVLWFWLGTGLKRGRSSARMWAITSSIFIVALLVAGLAFPEFGIRLAPWGIDQFHPAFFPLAGIILVVLVVPVAFLLGKKAQQAFLEKEDGEQAAASDRDKPPV